LLETTDDLHVLDLGKVNKLPYPCNYADLTQKLLLGCNLVLVVLLRGRAVPIGK
jgi:hypothetical protein